MDAMVRDLESIFPPTKTIFDFFVDVKSTEFKSWEEKVNAQWKPPPNLPFFRIVVPTVDTLRNAFVVAQTLRAKQQSPIVGDTGTGKTIIVQAQLDQLPEKYATLNINFSSATTSNATQNIIEGIMEKRSKIKYGPPGGKQPALAQVR